MSASTTVLFIGCGNMGASIIGGALRHLPAARILALDPDLPRARSLLPRAANVTLVAHADDLPVTRPDLVILGIKPQIFSQLDPALRHLMADTPVVSIMAGIPLPHLIRGLGHGKVIRVMPNLPALVGAGMSLGCTAPGSVEPQVLTMVETLFSALGAFRWAADEDQFERANPVFSCGPGFVFAIAEQMIAAATAAGVPADLADLLVRQTFLGSARMLAEDPRSAAEMKRAVTSPKGTTEAGLAVLEAVTALPSLLPRTLQAAHHRALELARQG